MNAFFRELRDARVYRAAVSYAVVSWLILQLAAIVGPALGMPPWTLAATIGVLVCGFTAALWTGWMQHHQRRPADDPGAALLRRRHHLAFALLSGLPALAVVTGFVYLHGVGPVRGRFYRGDPPMGKASEKSIAVLPFDNLSDDQSNAYFAEGIQDEILTDLAKVADLKVISRASVMGYGAGHARDVRTIGAALGVAYLLEGSVQKAAGRVRVEAQLIDARTDTHKWADRYDRDLSDVFAIQSEMAERIVGSLRAKISPGEKAVIDARPTNDLAAYDLYLRGKTTVDTFQQAADWRETLLGAVRLLDEATTRDGNFALAYCQLARAHDQLYFTGLDRSPVRLALEENATAAALRLQPDLGEAHLARALVLYHGRRDYNGTRRELAVARAALPNSAEVYSLITYLARREGRWQDALPAQEQAVSLDPRNANILGDRTVTYDMMRLYRDEVRTADAAAAASPESTDYFRALKAAALLSAGQTAAARVELGRLPAGYDPNGTATYLRVCAALYERRPAEAAGIVAAFGGKEYPGVNGALTPRAWLEGLVARAAGDAAKAKAALLEARGIVEGSVRAGPDDPLALALLGQIDAGLGRKEDALREGRQAVAMQPVSVDAMDGPGVEASLAMIYTWTGEEDAAMGHLGALAKIPGGPDYGQLRFDPVWDGLRDRADFKEMLVRLDPHFAP